jgi:hypothetical protein
MLPLTLMPTLSDTTILIAMVICPIYMKQARDTGGSARRAKLGQDRAGGVLNTARAAR